MPPKKKDSLQATPPKKAVKKTVSKKGKKVPKKKVKQNKLQKLQIFFQKYFSYILTGAISTSILFLFAYYFISKSYFYNYIPKNTQKFVHIELTKARGALDFYSGIKEIMQSDIDEEILKKLVELKIPYLTLLSDKENSSAFLIEKISEKKAKIFLKSFQSTEEELTFHKENNISSISILSGKETYCVHKTYTLFCSSTAQGTTSFKDGNFSDPKTLKNKIKKIPYQSFIRWYINPQSLDTPFLEVHKDFLQDIYGGVKIKKEDTIEVFMDIKTQTQREKATEKSENFLSKYFSKDDTLFYLSGKNFQNRWITIEEYYKEKSPEYALILKGILQKKISELFGNEIDFYSDILPLFEKEFAFAINKIQEESFISFISQTKQFTKIEELLDTFFKNRGQFTVEKKELKINEEIVLNQVYSNESKVSEINERIGAARVIGYEIEEKPWGIFIAQKGNMVYISSSKDGIKQMLSKKEYSLEKSFPEKLRHPYEFGFINISSFHNFFSFSPFPLPKLENLSEIKSLSWESEDYEEGRRVVGNIEF